MSDARNLGETANAFLCRTGRSRWGQAAAGLASDRVSRTSHPSHGWPERTSRTTAFSRLCHPAWVSGNLAYLKDLDYMEARLASTKAPRSNRTEEDQSESKSKKNPRKFKGEGKGKSTPTGESPGNS